MIAARRKGTETDGPSLGDTPHAQFASDSLFNMLIAANDPDTPGEKMLADEDVTGRCLGFIGVRIPCSGHPHRQCVLLLIRWA